MLVAVPLTSITCTWHSAQYQSSYPLIYSQFRAREELFRDSSDEDSADGAAIHHVFDKMYEYQEDFPLSSAHAFPPLPTCVLHPFTFSSSGRSISTTSTRSCASRTFPLPSASASA